VTGCLRALVVVSNADGTILVQSVSPEALERDLTARLVSLKLKCELIIILRLRHGVVGEQEPETEDWLGEDIKDSVAEDLSIDVDVAGSVSNTPNTENR
jgi:hypothetical protein